MTLNFVRWCFDPQVWIILGILLIIADVFLGYDFFVLPTGVAAFIIAAVLHGQEAQWIEGTVLFSTWHQVMISYAVLSILSIVGLRFVLQRKRKNNVEEDINDY